MIITSLQLRRTTALAVASLLLFPILSKAMTSRDDMEVEGLPPLSSKTKSSLPCDNEITKKARLEAPLPEWIIEAQNHNKSVDATLVFFDSSQANVRNYLFSFLNPQELSALRLTATSLNSDVLNYIATTDKRNLKSLQWFQDHPSLDSLDNFRLNASIWYAIKTLVRLIDHKRTSPTLNRDSLLELQKPLPLITRYLKDYFKKYKDLVDNFEYFRDQAYRFIMYSQPFKTTDEYNTFEYSAGNQEYAGNQSLMRCLQYIHDPNYNPMIGFFGQTQLWDPTTRHYCVMQARQTVSMTPPQNLTEQEIQEFWKRQSETTEFIISNSIVPPTIYDFRKAALSHFNNKNYAQAAIRFEETFQKFPQQASINDLRDAALSHFKNKNYAQAAKLYDNILQKFPQEASIDNFRKAAVSHFNNKNYAQAAIRFEEAFQEFPQQASINDLRDAALSHFKNKNYAQAAELYENILQKFHHQTNYNDFTFAANACLQNQNYARAAELYEKIIQMFPQQASINDLRDAGVANFWMGEFEKSVKHFTRALKMSGSSKNMGSYFIALHADLFKYIRERNECLKENIFDSNDINIYQTLFKGTNEEILQSLETYIIKHASDKNSRLSRIVLHVAWMMHTQAGNTIRANELKGIMMP